MRFFDSDAYCYDVEYRLSKLQDMATPEQFEPSSDLFYDADETGVYQTNWGLFPFNSAKYVWAKGSINGVDVAKIKTLLFIKKYLQQEHLSVDYDLRGMFLKRGGMLFTGGQSAELATQLTDNKENYFTLTFEVPDGWDGRNSFIKMESFGSFTRKNLVSQERESQTWIGYQGEVAGPSAITTQVAWIKDTTAMGWTIEKTARLINISFKYDIDGIIDAEDAYGELDARFMPINIKLWRSSNVSRR